MNIRELFGAKEPSRSYPYIGRRTAPYTVVLFTSAKTGFLLAGTSTRPDPGEAAGFWMSTWGEEDFTPLAKGEQLVLVQD